MNSAIQTYIDTALDQPHQRYAGVVNPQLSKVLKTIGFDQTYAKAQGAYLYDTEGNKYLDGLGGYGVFNIGRNHPRMREALHAALDADLPSMVQMDAPGLAALLAERLIDVVKVPHIDTIFFTNSGTEAVEGAIKFAHAATGRRAIVYFDHAFHGLTNGSLSLNGNPQFRTGFAPLLPDCRAIPLGDIDALRAELAKGDVAAFVIEPIQGKGVNQAETRFYDEAIKLCRAHDTLVIADEIQTGFGRTGRMFAFQAWTEQPDIVCMAKALSGGYIPVGAIAYPRAVYNKVFSSMDRCVVHSNTFGRNSLAMIAGLTTLDILADEKLPEVAARQGSAILNAMRDLQGDYEMLADVRGEGLMIGLEFARPKSLKLRTGWDLIHKLNSGLFGQLVVVPLYSKHRILSQVAGHNSVIKLLPPLCLTDQDTQWLIEGLTDVIKECHRFPGSAWKVGKDLAKRAASASRM